MISVKKVILFHNHPFRLYEGKRLDDMVESVREHGILILVIVQKKDGGYEMLSGHNRWNAAKIAGIKEIPAIIKDNLTEREAYVCVIETNMLQRSFDELLPSEKVAVLTERYEKVMCQGRRNDILEETAMLNGVDTSLTCGHDVHRSKSRDSIGENYGMTGRNIARYNRCNNLIPEFKVMLDDGALALVVGVELSYLAEDEQVIVKEAMEKNCVKLNTGIAKELRLADGSVTEENIQKLLGVDKPVETAETKKPVSVKIPAKVYSKYFSNVSAKDVQGILEEALDLYFEKRGMSIV
ncbi:ParB N-terminal domain-containing protein [Faecalicatena orotica]|uniref:ParB family chromosome partitioning protein n=1 Tax=Faecalicatena orotica TaxID=1544 RepID=A0A2Y9BCY0_9FIRM|nr:ParB N-terminal domain-containing protein [Faecalicatena orotica]PWJ32303.1 ParB family chromosome partitioning protein [Faecalicatena orotica]SSA54137.1 chromosome partitioning protein, ParB family [Faecalicatena orotica]